MKKLLCICVLCLGVALQARAQQPNNDYQKVVEEMIEVSGSGEVFQAVVPQIFGMLKGQLPNVPDVYWTEAEAEMAKTANGELAALLVPVYHKYLSIGELREIIAFYKTPAGKKLAEVTPQISSDAMVVGQQWGMQLGQRIYKQLQEKGLL